MGMHVAYVCMKHLLAHTHKVYTCTHTYACV